MLRIYATGMTLALLPLFLFITAVGAASAEIALLAPPDGSVTGESEIVIIGTDNVTGQGEMEVILNNIESTVVPIQAGTFSTLLTLRGGRNIIVFRNGAREKRVTLKYSLNGEDGMYLFHGGTGDGTCRDCHTPGARWEQPGRQKELCYSCHDEMEEFSYLHGPVGAGQCTFCHDPHGSSQSGFLVASGKDLCLHCHSQSSSGSHIEDPQKAICVSCHDPHGARRRFFLK